MQNVIRRRMKVGLYSLKVKVGILKNNTLFLSNKIIVKFMMMFADLLSCCMLTSKTKPMQQSYREDIVFNQIYFEQHSVV